MVFGFFASSVLLVLLILLNDVFKLSIYLDIYIFCVWTFCPPEVYPWYTRGISVKDSEFKEVFILRCLLVTCANKTSQVLTLKLTADLMQA